MPNLAGPYGLFEMSSRKSCSQEDHFGCCNTKKLWGGSIGKIWRQEAFVIIQARHNCDLDQSDSGHGKK